MYNQKEENSEGESQLYVGIGYLGLISNLMTEISFSQEQAWREKGDALWTFYNRIRKMYVTIENQLPLRFSDKEVELRIYVTKQQQIVKEKIKVKEKELMQRWLEEIEKMIERHDQIITTSKVLKYNMAKQTLKEMENCVMRLYREANKKHLIMPRGKENMKDLVKKEWIDRDKKKNIFNK